MAVTRLGPGGYPVASAAAAPIVMVTSEAIQILETKLRTSLLMRSINETVRLVEGKLASVATEIVRLKNEFVQLGESRSGLIFAEVTRVINELLYPNEGGEFEAPDPPAATSPDQSLVTSHTVADDRNDFTGEVGVRLGIGPANIPVSWVGYRAHAGNTGLRTVTLYEWFSDSVVFTTTIDLTGAAADSWVWKAITPVTMLANGYYTLLTNTTAYDGQFWLNNSAVSMKPSITNIYATYRSGGTLGVTGINQTFVGLDLGWNGARGPSGRYIVTGGGSIIAVRKLVRLFAEGIRISEAILKSSALIRARTELVRVEQVVVRYGVITRVVNSMVRVNEILVQTRFIRYVIDELERISESVLRSRTMTRVRDEVMRVNETLANTSIVSRVIDELERISEDVLRSRAMIRVRDEIVQVVDGVAVAAMQLARLLDESVRVGEAVLTASGLGRVVNELVRIAENLRPTVALTRVRDEIVRVIEGEPVFLRPLIRVIDEVVRVTETLFRTLGLFRSVGETLTVKEKTEFATGQVWMANEPVTIPEVRIPTRRILRLRGEYVRSLETRQPVRALLRVVSDLLHLPELTRGIATIPTLVCSVIKLYAMYAGDAMLAPLVMGSVLVNPEVGGGSTSVYVAVDGSPEMEPLVDGQPETKPLVEAEVKIEECC